MKYRKEIDGLRALAVLPVALFHAGFHFFRGGFIGVDVFFVISGYLISSIILNDLQQNRFSIVQFYERRARRILPALFIVMAVSTVFACLWMLPDELKNYGQSLIATALFSNNILLAITSDYWSLASEFKPLLHTWSLGVEEQYYIFYPWLLFLCWYLLKKRFALALGSLAVLSFLSSLWCSLNYPDTSFYILPTRAWEIFAGALTAVCLMRWDKFQQNGWRNQILSGVGLLLIVCSVFFMNSDRSTAQLLLVPVTGTALVVLFASESTVVGRLLSNPVMVAAGLCSYSFYLWHQPMFALARVYSKNPPSQEMYALLILAAMGISYLSWRFIERPFRDKNRVSRGTIFCFALVGSLALIMFGAYLDRSYGMLSRMYDTRIASISVMDKRIYNERVFQFEKDRFSDTHRLRVLVNGNSFGRDFVNMTTETFDMKNIEIVYRHDFDFCILPIRTGVEKALYTEAEVVIFGSWDPKSDCIQSNDSYLEKNHKDYFYIGRKDFGYNLNWIRRLKSSERFNQYNELPQDALVLENEMATAIPADHYISLLAASARAGDIPITDEEGYLISTDRFHLTKFGAIFFGRKVLEQSRFGAILREADAADVANLPLPVEP